MRGPGEEEGDDDEEVVEAGEEEALVHGSDAALDDVLANADAEVGSLGVLECGDAPNCDEEKGGDEGDEEGFLGAPKGAGLGFEFDCRGVVGFALFPPKDSKGDEEGCLRYGVDEGAFGEESEGEPKGEEEVVEDGFAMAVYHFVQGGHGEHDEEDERHVGDGESRVNEDLQGGEPGGSGEEGELAVEAQSLREEEEEDGDEQGGLHGVHAGSDLVDAENFEVGAHPPVGEGRLVEAILVVEVGDNPFVAVDHLHGGVGEARLVAVNEGE